MTPIGGISFLGQDKIFEFCDYITIDDKSEKAKIIFMLNINKMLLIKHIFSILFTLHPKFKKK